MIIKKSFDVRSYLNVFQKTLKEQKVLKVMQPEVKSSQVHMQGVYLGNTGVLQVLIWIFLHVTCFIVFSLPIQQKWL